MHKNASRRLSALVVALAMIAAACSSSGSDIAAAADVDGGDNTSTTEPGDPAALADGPIDPALVEQLGGSLMGTPLTGENTACLIERADDDLTLTGVLKGVADPGFQFGDETFTALATGLHACVNPGLLAASVLGVSGATTEEGRSEFSVCVNEAITDAVDGDLAYTGLAALNVSFPVPDGAADATIAAARACVDARNLVDQFASSTEAGSGFLIEVDRQCVSDAVDDEFLDEFWPTLVRGEEATTSLESTLTDCSSEFDSGLDPELPVDFEPWAGTRALAGVEGTSRVFVYDTAPPMSLEDGVDYQAILETVEGTVTIDLFEDEAPITVNNFVSLARDGYYDNTVFHRVIDNFMAQGGDPSASGSGGPGYTFEDEESGLTPIDRRGLLAMANSGPDTNGGQFFITFAAATHLDGLHTVFGEVVEGDDVLASIDIRDPQAPTTRGESLISVIIVEN
ncbi:MAG: peptidylprolyl isomerase [Acidimicrobiales bacterium]